MARLTSHAATGSLTGNFRTGKRGSCWWHFERSTRTHARVMRYYLVETVRVKKMSHATWKAGDRAYPASQSTGWRSSARADRSS